MGEEGENYLLTLGIYRFSLKNNGNRQYQKRPTFYDQTLLYTEYDSQAGSETCKPSTKVINN